MLVECIHRFVDPGRDLGVVKTLSHECSLPRWTGGSIMLRGRGRALGYLVVPPDLVDSFAAAQSVTNRHAPLLEQAILTDFISGGHFGRHVRRMREVYAERLGVLIESARERLKGLLDVSEVEAGLQTADWLQGGIDGPVAARAASRPGVEVTPLVRYGRGIRALAAALEGVRTAPA